MYFINQIVKYLTSARFLSCSIFRNFLSISSSSSGNWVSMLCSVDEEIAREQLPWASGLLGCMWLFGSIGGSCTTYNNPNMVLVILNGNNDCIIIVIENIFNWIIHYNFYRWYSFLSFFLVSSCYHFGELSLGTFKCPFFDTFPSIHFWSSNLLYSAMT